MPDLTLIATVTIFIATYAVVAVGKVPVYRIDRAGAALLGGSLMLAIGVLTPQEAYRAIDFDTITLLLGMMIVVANLRVCGFFRWSRIGSRRMSAGRSHCWWPSRWPSRYRTG